MGPGDPGRQDQGGELSVFTPTRRERERNPFAVAIRPDPITLGSARSHHARPAPGDTRPNTK